MKLTPSAAPARHRQEWNTARRVVTQVGAQRVRRPGLGSTGDCDHTISDLSSEQLQTCRGGACRNLVIEVELLSVQLMCSLKSQRLFTSAAA